MAQFGIENDEPGRATGGKLNFSKRAPRMTRDRKFSGRLHQAILILLPHYLVAIPFGINKYNVLDLREENSFAKWAVDRKHSVFVISLVNQDEACAHQ